MECIMVKSWPAISKSRGQRSNRVRKKDSVLCCSKGLRQTFGSGPWNFKRYANRDPYPLSPGELGYRFRNHFRNFFKSPFLAQGINLGFPLLNYNQSAGIDLCPGSAAFPSAFVRLVSFAPANAPSPSSIIHYTNFL